MKVCDRHHDKTAGFGILLLDTQETLDLCSECMDEIHAFIGSEHNLAPKKKRTLLERVKDSVKAD